MATFVYLVGASIVVGFLCILILSRLFGVTGKGDVLTVCNQSTILKHGERVGFWNVAGASLHEVPLPGFFKSEFKIRNLEQYQDLGLFIPALNFSAPGKKSLLFLIKFDWLIHEDKSIKSDIRSNAPTLCNCAYTGIMKNNLPEALCEYIQSIVSDMVGCLNEGRENVPFSGKFSTYAENHVLATLSREDRSSASPFINIRMTDFQVALCTEGKRAVLI